ncbi:MAG TPA: carbohydrate-binding family 9-like protein [Thermoanaerobaculia bacterium]|nr:carbohydrate-binding family 9-like protein [Thermoanaerobaculia bacterium]
MQTLPRLRVPHAPRSWKASASLEDQPWAEVEGFTLDHLADGTGPPAQPTRVSLCQDQQFLYIRFDRTDRDAWGTYERRDDPIYEEEAVEVFLAAGEDDPLRYYEFEVSPRGVLFDAVIHNPTSQKADRTADLSWDCPGLLWQAGAGAAAQDWWAALAIPWSAIGQARVWRANFYRIERPRDGAPEFSCWSPTLTSPADFHKPARFGVLEL